MRSYTLNTTLTNHEYYALLALADNTLHGYGVRDQIAHDSESTLILAPGTVYALLHRLVQARLVETIEPRDTDVVSIVRRYRITAYGRQRLSAEITRLERVINHTRYKLGQSPFR